MEQSISTPSAWDKFEFEPQAQGIWIRLGSESNSPTCFVTVMDLEALMAKCDNPETFGKVYNAFNMRKRGVNDLGQVQSTAVIPASNG